MPVSPIGGVTPAIGGPRYDVGHTGPDLVIAAGAAVRLDRAGRGDLAHIPRVVGLAAVFQLDPTARGDLVDLTTVTAALVAARTHTTRL
jgi:hypothetical protein